MKGGLSYQQLHMQNALLIERLRETTVLLNDAHRLIQELRRPTLLERLSAFFRGFNRKVA